MARFINIPKQEITSFSPTKNIDFYANILNKAQGDLERATAMKAAALEKYGDLTAYTQEDRDLTWGAANKDLANVLDADFVSPSRVASAVMETNKKVMPYVQALKAKASAAEQYDKLRMAYGANAWLGVDPRQQSIIDPNTGGAVDPSRFKAVGINVEDVDKTFLASQLSNLTESFDRTVPSDLFGYHKIEKVTGLDDAQREETYAPGTSTAIQIAKAQLESMPQLKEIFGSEEEALRRLMVRNYQTSGNYKQSVDSQYITNRGVLDAEARARLGGSGTPPVLFKPIQGDVETTNVTNDLIKQFVPDNSLNVNSSDIKFDKSGKLISDVQTVSGKPYDKEKGEKLEGAFAGAIGRAREKNTVLLKTLTEMRKSLRSSGLSVVTDKATGKPRARTDQEVFNFYNQAALNSANTFGKNFEINPGLDIIGANSFFAADGSRKDFRNANVEIDRNDGKGWQSIDESKFAEELGFDISNGKEKSAYNDALKSFSGKVYDFMGKEVKMRTALTNKDGKEISVRYSATPEVNAYKRPVVEMYNIFTKPTPIDEKTGRGKVIPVAYDAATRKPVYIEVASDFTITPDGQPLINPVVLGISQDTETGKYYQQIYNSLGYSGLLDIVQSSTDEALIGSGNVYTNKAVNLRPIEN